MMRPKYTLENEKHIFSELVEKKWKRTEIFSRIWNPYCNIYTPPNIVLCFPVILCCGALFSAVVSQLK